MTYVGRKCRVGVRPLVASPTGQITWVKRSYDLLGTLVTTLLLNFAAAPFMLLTFEDSIKVWSRLGWYGCWIVGLGVAFFNVGGSEYLQSLQKKQPRSADIKELQIPPPYVVASLEAGVEAKRMN